MRVLLIFSILMMSSVGLAEKVISCKDSDGGTIFTDDKSRCHNGISVHNINNSNLSSGAVANILIDVIYDDPFSHITDKPLFTENIKAAGDLWSQYINGTGHIEILVKVLKDNNGRTSAASKYSSLYLKRGKKRIFEQSVAYEIRTGNDKNGGTVDMVIQIDKDALNRLWLDPKPRTRSEPLPRDRTDAITVFMHEFGHALGFSGWLDTRAQYSKLGSDFSTFDRHIIFINNIPYFSGELSTKLYGQPIPLTTHSNNYTHVGDDISNKHTALKSSIMNGITFKKGQRYFITNLDLAILNDIGIALKKPVLRALNQSIQPTAKAGTD